MLIYTVYIKSELTMGLGAVGLSGTMSAVKIICAILAAAMYKKWY